MNNLGALLRKQYRYTWFLFGATFLLFCYSWQADGNQINLGPPLALLLLYFAAGQLVATICAHRIENSRFEMERALFGTTIKIGFISGLFSVGFHLLLVYLPFELELGTFEFRSIAAVIIGGMVFPFMGCVSAAARLKN